MFEFTKNELNTILYATSGLLIETVEELERITKADPQYDNFVLQRDWCKSVIDKVKGYTDF